MNRLKFFRIWFRFGGDIHIWKNLAVSFTLRNKKLFISFFQGFFSLLWRGFFSKFVAVFSWLKFSSIINSLSKSFVWRGSRFYTVISRRFLKILRIKLTLHAVSMAPHCQTPRCHWHWGVKLCGIEFFMTPQSQSRFLICPLVAFKGTSSQLKHMGEHCYTMLYYYKNQVLKSWLTKSKFVYYKNFTFEKNISEKSKPYAKKLQPVNNGTR